MENKLFYENLFSCTFDYYDNFDPPIEHNDWWIILFIVTLPIQICLILIDIFFKTEYFTKFVRFLIGQKSISPISVGNYAHAQYMHWIEESRTYCQDCEFYNRYNIPEKAYDTE